MLEQGLWSLLSENDKLPKNGLNEHFMEHFKDYDVCNALPVQLAQKRAAICFVISGLWTIVWWLLHLHTAVFTTLKAHIWILLSLLGADSAVFWSDSPSVSSGATLHLGRNLSILKYVLLSNLHELLDFFLGYFCLRTDHKEGINVSVGLNISITGKKILSQQHAFFYEAWTECKIPSLRFSLFYSILR